MQVRGRHLVVAWTTVFLAVVGVIVWRTRNAYLLQSRIAVLDDHVRALTSDRDRLVSRIAQLSTQQQLQPKAEAMGLRIASDSEMVELPLPPVR